MSTTYTVRFPDGATYGPAEVPLLQQWAREGRLTPETVLVPGDGSPECKAMAMDSLRALVMAPPTVATGAPPPPAPDAVSTLIPYRNMPALVGYYVSIASLIPVAGLVCGPAAVILGVTGFRRSRAQRHVKGAAHAWVAITIGTLTSIANWGVVAVAFGAAMF